MLSVSHAQLLPDGSPTGPTFSHEFSPGKITVVLGANRSGKTDLCRLIAGLNAQAVGTVCWQGLDLAATPVSQRSVAMVFQAFINYPNLTVRENIASPLIAQGVDAGERGARVEELAGKLRIADLLERLPNELSGGQQQRLAIARALAKGADVLLLDEPLVNLDFKLREALEVELRELLADQRTTVIYTSSDPREVFNVADEVLLLERGNKLQAGTPLEVYRNPASEAAMNLLSDPGVNRFQDAGQRGAVRPEHVRLDGSGDCRFDFLVAGLETNGDVTFVHGDVAGHAWVVRQNGMATLSVGQRITVSAMNADVRLF